MWGFRFKVDILYLTERIGEASWVTKQHISFVTRLCDAHFRYTSAVRIRYLELNF